MTKEEGKEKKEKKVFGIFRIAEWRSVDVQA